MKEYILNEKESLTVMDVVQDALDRGMVADHYETGKLEEIIGETTDEFDLFKRDTKFEMVIRVKTAKVPKKAVEAVKPNLIVTFRHPMHGIKEIQVNELVNQAGVIHAKNIYGVTFQTLEPGWILSVNGNK